jgi:hypothetical protein
MGTHSTLVGGSTAARVINCPASVRLSKDIPPGPESDHARRGSALHWLMEQHLMDEPAIPHPGTVVNGHTITDDDILALRDAQDATDELFKQHDVDEFEPEGKVSYGDIPNAFGTCDIVAKDKDGNLIIADYKFGEGVMVHPAHNAQLLFYAGAVITGPEFRDWYVVDSTRVTLAVIQPAQDPTLVTWSCTVKDVLRFVDQLRIAVKQTADEDATPNPGDHCRWCPAMAVCPRRIKDAQAVNRLKKDHLNDLAVAMALADDLEPWIRAVRKTVHEQLEHGARVPGYKLVLNRARRLWTDEDTLLAKLKRMRKLSQQDYLDAKLKSVAQLEKLCKTKGVDFEQFEDHYAMVAKGTSVVPDTDPRKGIVKSGDRDIPEQLDKLMNGNGNGDK